MALLELADVEQRRQNGNWDLDSVTLEHCCNEVRCRKHEKIVLVMNLCTWMTYFTHTHTEHTVNILHTSWSKVFTKNTQFRLRRDFDTAHHTENESPTLLDAVLLKMIPDLVQSDFETEART